jgi:membrane-associated phospholipid phosphatase
MKAQIIRLIRWVRKFIREKFHSGNEDLPYYITIVLAVIVFAVTISAFVEITESLTENKLNPYDTAVTDFVLRFRGNHLTSFLTFVTHLGDRFAYIAITTILGAYFWIRFRNWKFTLQMVLVLLLSSVSNVAIKRVINRARPSLDHLVEVNTLSFPSGHSMSAMAFYGFLIYLCMRFKMQRPVRLILILVLTVLIFSIGLSRIYLGVHFPSDVAAGFLGGLIWIAFSAVVFNVFDLLRKRRRAKTANSPESEPQ